MSELNGSVNCFPDAGSAPRSHRTTFSQLADASADYAESARPIAASKRPVELGISERPHYRDTATVTAKGALI
jgi:hypothetical protein